MSVWSEFISETRGAPFQWGVNDCALWAASAVERVSGVDPAVSLRRTYDTEFGCRRIVIRAGGLLSLSRALMGGAKSQHVTDGPCVARSQGQTVCGLLSGDRLFLKLQGGLVMPAEFEILDSWKI